MFITFEGIEGSGKTTLMSALLHRLRAMGHAPLVLREPGGTQVGDMVRAIFLEPAVSIAPLAETLLVNASRAQLVSEVVHPALAAGRIVLCDRYVDSTLAYQGYGRGLDLVLVREICRIATSGLEPTLTLLIDVSLETSRRRVATRGATQDRIDAQDMSFHDRVRSGFLELAKQSSRYRVLDGEVAPHALEEAAFAEIVKVLV